MLERMREAFVHQATVSMTPDADPAAVGATVTTALCGHWEHEPPCPLAPHHTSAVRDGDVVHVRMLFACEPEQEAEVRARIHAALAGGRGPLGRADTWVLRGSGPDDVQESERAHAGRLAAYQ
jgi:hypothetical protein